MTTSVAPKLCIETVGKRSEKVTRIKVTFGPDRHYDLTILIDPAITPDSVRKDGRYRPGAHLRLGGLNDTADCEECTVFRALGEYENLRNKEASEDARIVATKQAIEACYVALKGIDDDTAIVVCEASAGKFVPRVTEVVKK